MRIFLEMALIGKTAKLLLLAKTDRNIIGQQLVALLSGHDFSSDRGANYNHPIQSCSSVIIITYCIYMPMI
jgi:hypothetical protein